MEHFGSEACHPVIPFDKLEAKRASIGSNLREAAGLVARKKEKKDILN
jgi:hypothetical protein